MTISAGAAAAFLVKSRKPLLVGFLQQRACKLQICVLWFGQSGDCGWQQQWTAWFSSHTKNLLKDFGGTGALEVSSPTSCSKQVWLQSQSKLVSALPSWVKNLQGWRSHHHSRPVWSMASRISLVTASGFLHLWGPCKLQEQLKVWLDPPPSPPPGWPKPLSQWPLNSSFCPSLSSTGCFTV